MTVDYGTGADPVAGAARSAAPSEVTRWTNLNDTLADIGTRLDDNAAPNSTSPDVGVENMHRMFAAVATAAPLASQRLVLHYATAQKAIDVASILTMVAGTGSSGLTLARVGIYTGVGSGTLTLAGSSASDTTLWNSTFNEYDKALSASVSIAADQRFAFAMLAVGTTMPVLYGIAPIGAMAEREPRLTHYLAGQSDLPASVSEASLTGFLGATAYMAGLA